MGSLDDAYEPLLKEEDAQYGFDSERGTATLGATRRGIRGHQRHQFRPRDQGTTRFISSKNSRFRVLLVLRSNPVAVLSRLICFMASVKHDPCQATGFADFS